MHVRTYVHIYKNMYSMSRCSPLSNEHNVYTQICTNMCNAKAKSVCFWGGISSCIEQSLVAKWWIVEHRTMYYVWTYVTQTRHHSATIFHIYFSSASRLEFYTQCTYKHTEHFVSIASMHATDLYNSQRPCGRMMFAWMHVVLNAHIYPYGTDAVLLCAYFWYIHNYDE